MNAESFFICSSWYLCTLCAVTLSLNTSVLKYLIIFLPGKENCHLHLQMRNCNREILSPNIQRDLDTVKVNFTTTHFSYRAQKQSFGLKSTGISYGVILMCADSLSSVFWRDVNKYNVINESKKQTNKQTKTYDSRWSKK